MNESQTIIEMSGVAVGTMRDPAVTVLEDVNWKVAAGDFWVVAGLHRSGKTDFMMLAGGMMPPQRGWYHLFGQTMPIFEEEDLPTRLRMGFVFDGGRLFNNLTVAENIALPLRYHGRIPPEEQARRVRNLLEMTGLAQWENSTPANLGRNWCQRVGLARALALQPELLLLDSPLSGLDVRDAAWWLQFLEQLSAGHEFMPDKRPTTLVASTEDLRPWRNRAKQFALLHDGRFESVGDREHLGEMSTVLVNELLAEEK